MNDTAPTRGRPRSSPTRSLRIGDALWARFAPAASAKSRSRGEQAHHLIEQFVLAFEDKATTPTQTAPTQGRWPNAAPRSIRISLDLWHRFEPAARAQSRSRNSQAHHLVEQFVLEHEASQTLAAAA